MRPRRYYPMFADLTGRDCVIVGGGLIAQRKATTLLRYGARLTVVSPRLTRRLAAYAKHGRIRHLARTFRSADLRGAWLVYAATDDARVNRAVQQSAQRRQLFANIVDQTPLCSFIAPAIAVHGSVTVAVSTGGASPSLAKRLRTDIERLLGREYAPLARLLRNLRGIAKRRLPSYQDRKVYFDRLLGGKVIPLIRAGHGEAAKRYALAVLEQEAKRRNGHRP